MYSEHLLHRLAKTENPVRRGSIRQKILKRIEGASLQRLSQNITPEERTDLRDQILSRITRPKTVNTLTEVSTLLSPTWEGMQMVRAEILDRIEAWQPTPSWHRYGKLVAITTVLALLLRVTPILFIAAPLQAESQTLLLPTQGIVSMTDGAEWTEVSEQLILDHPLTIRTGIEGAATIILRDETVLRLSENTEITLRETAFDSEREGPIARISYGQVWMTSLLPEAMFVGSSVILPQGILALKNGSVSMFADPGQSTVQVFHRFAKVLPTGVDPVHLIQGDQLTLYPNGDTQRHVITNAMRTNEWVVSNLSRDAVHRANIAEKKEMHAETVAGILPTSAFYSLKRASEQLDVWMTLSTNARQEKKLQHAETRIHEAVSLLKSGNPTAAENSLAEYREAIHAFASLTQEEARHLLTSSLIDSSTTVAAAFPHSDLYPAKRAILEAATEASSTDISLTQVDLYLLSDALLGIEELITQSEVLKAVIVLQGIEGAIASVLTNQQLDGMEVAKEELKAIKTILRSITYSINQAKEVVNPEQTKSLVFLEEHLAKLSPSVEQTTVALSTEGPHICMTVREVTRRTNQFLASVFTYETPRAQRNEVLRQIASLPDCPQSGRILSKVMNKVPVFTRSFVWEALQNIDSTI